MLRQVAVAYWPSLRGDFIWDDDALITRNAVVQAPDGLYKIWFTREMLDYWPVTNTSFWLEWRAWHTHALGYRIVNVVLHIINASLIWLILRNLGIPGAYLAALLFAVHPMNVDSVAWIAQRKNTLLMFPFFAIGAVLTWINVWFQTRGGQEVIRSANVLERIVAAGAIVWFYLLSVCRYCRGGQSSCRTFQTMDNFPAMKHHGLC